MKSALTPLAFNDKKLFPKRMYRHLSPQQDRWEQAREKVIGTVVDGGTIPLQSYCCTYLGDLESSIREEFIVWAAKHNFEPLLKPQWEAIFTAFAIRHDRESGSVPRDLASRTKRVMDTLEQNVSLHKPLQEAVSSLEREILELEDIKHDLTSVLQGRFKR